MFITNKIRMSRKNNTVAGGTLKFLGNRMESNTREFTEKAVAHYIRENNLTPKQFAKGEFRITWLHYYLCIYDPRWLDVPPHEVKTTPPR